MKIKLLIISLFISFLIQIIECAIDYQIVANSRGETEFIVLNGNSLKLPNRHRHNQPELKLTLHGSTIDKYESGKTEQNWLLRLGDKSSVELNSVEVGQTTALQLRWIAGLSSNEEREICVHFSAGSNNVSWYNTYKSANHKFPMDTIHKGSTTRQPFNYLFNGDCEEFCHKLEHLFLNTDGFAILLDQYAPWYIRHDSNHNDPLLCFSVHNFAPYSVNSNDSSYLDMKMYIYSSSNIRTVTDYAVHRSGVMPKPKSIPDERLFTYPSWHTHSLDPNLKQSELMTFGDDIVKHGFSSKSTIWLDGAWEAHQGDFAFDPKLFPNFDHSIATLHKTGFHLGVLIFSQVVTQNLEETEQYFVKSGNDKRTVLIDFSNPDSCKWFGSILERLHYENGINSFLADTHPLESGFKVHDPLVQKFPAQLVRKYIETIGSASNSSMSIYSYKTQHVPVFSLFYPSVQLNQTTFDLVLQELIPNVLSVSLGGYSFITPYAVGWPFYDSKPSAELYIRWVQAIALLPSIAFYRPPWVYQNESIVQITRKFVDLHTEHAPLIIELAKKRIANGSPIVRPMWYASPDDSNAHKIGDQFMLGDDLVVAPVTSVGVRERTVYLPTGNWIDQHGKSYHGAGQFKVEVPLEELAYFTRKH